MSLKPILQKILLIDANSDDRAALIPALMQTFPGLYIEEISQADQLDAAIATASFDLVITEMHLQGMTGLDVLRTLQTPGKPCPVILWTCTNEVETAVAALKAGAADYIVKSPQGQDRLLQAVSQAWQAVQWHQRDEQIETRLQPSKPLHSYLMNTLDTIVWEGDPQTLRFTFVSQPAEPILGYSIEQWLEPNFWVNHLHPDDRDAVVDYCRATIQAQQDHRLEYRLMAADGRVVWVEDLVTVIVENQRVVQLVGLMMDISERKAAEAALQKSEEQRRLALDLTNTGSWDLNLQTEEAIWSESKFRLLGLVPGEVQAHYQIWRDRVHPDDLERVEQAVADVLQNQAVLEVEYRVVHPDGTIRWMLARGQGIYDEFGRPLRLVGVMMDVSDRKQAELVLREAEAALQESESRFQEIAQTVSQLFFVRSAVTRQFLYISPAYETMWGRSCQSLYQNPESWMESVYPDDRPYLLQSVAQQFTGQPVTCEYRILRADGAIRWIFTQIKPIHDETGTLIRFIGFADDITERKQLELALQASEAKLNDILDSAPTAIVRLRVFSNQDWQIDYLSAGCELVFGYSATDFWQNKSLWIDRIEPDDVEKVILPLFQAVYQGQTATYEYRFYHKDGTLRWIAGKMLSRWDESAHCWLVTQSALDITERKRTQLLLQEREQAYRALVENSPDFIERFDTDLRHLYVSPSLAKATGLPVEAYLGQTCRDMGLDDSMVTQWEAAAQALLTTGQRQTIEFDVPMPTGVNSFEMRIAPEMTQDNQIESIICISRNITERKQLEAGYQQAIDELRQRDEILRKLSERIPGVIFQYQLYPDGRSCFPYASEGIREIYEVTPEQVKSDATAVFTVLHPDDLERVAASIQESARRLRLWHTQYRVVLSQKGVRWLEGQSMPEALPDGSILWHGYIWDITEQKAAESALRENETRFRQLAESVHEVFWIANYAFTQILYVNAAYEKIWGQSCNDLYAYPQSFMEAIHKQDQDRVLQIIKQQRHLGWQLEYRICRPDGSIRWIDEQASPIYDAHGQPYRIVGTCRDITKRKQAEQALRESEERFRQLAENIRQIFYLSDLQETRILYISPSYETIWGRSCQSLYQQPQSYVEAVHPDDRDRVGAAYERQRLGEATEDEYRIIRPDGSIRWILDRGSPVRDESGQIYRVCGIAEDITDRKAAEMALYQLNQELENRVEERTAQLKLAMSASKMGSWEWDVQTNISYWSPEVYELFGCPRHNGSVLSFYGEQPRLPQTADFFFNRVHPDDLAYVQLCERKAVEERSPFEMEFRICLPDGRVRWIYDRGACVVNDQGQPVKLTGIVLDISDRKQAEAAIRQQARQEQLLRLITHEIRQSLDLDAILTTAVTEVRQTLQADRVAVYRFHEDWSGSFIVESVGAAWNRLVGPNIHKVWEDTYLQATQGGRYRNHETFAVTNIYTVGHQPCHIALLEQFQAKAYAIAPIFSGDLLWGLLAIYQNSAPREWQSWEIELLQQIATQLAIALQQSELYRQLQTELQERRQIEDQLRGSLKEKEVLLREVYHRVKNNMQMVSSLLHLQSDSVSDPRVLKLLSESQQRVKTMSLIHERLYRSKNLARINVATYIQDLVHNLLESYTSSHSSIQTTLNVADLELDLDTAVPCGLIINELMSNALKYAFPEQQGKITLTFRLEETGYYCLIVQDNGIGLPAHLDPQQTDSLGMQLIYGLTEQLGGTIELDRQGGSQFKISFMKKA